MPSPFYTNWRVLIFTVCVFSALTLKNLSLPSVVHSTHVPFLQSFFNYCLLIHGVFEDPKTGSSSLPSSIFISAVYIIFWNRIIQSLLTACTVHNSTYSHCLLVSALFLVSRAVLRRWKLTGYISNAHKLYDSNTMLCMPQLTLHYTRSIL